MAAFTKGFYPKKLGNWAIARQRVYELARGSSTVPTCLQIYSPLAALAALACSARDSASQLIQSKQCGHVWSAWHCMHNTRSLSTLLAKHNMHSTKVGTSSTWAVVGARTGMLLLGELEELEELWELGMVDKLWEVAALGELAELEVLVGRADWSELEELEELVELGELEELPELAAIAAFAWAALSASILVSQPSRCRASPLNWALSTSTATTLTPISMSANTSPPDPAQMTMAFCPCIKYLLRIGAAAPAGFWYLFSTWPW